MTASVTGLRLAASSPSPDRVRATVEEVLSRPAYDELRRDPLREAVAAVRRVVAQWLADLLTSPGGGLIGWVLLVAAAAIAGVVVWRILRRVRREPAAHDVVTAAQGATVDDHLATARRAEAAGDLRAAVGARYRALVLDLIQRGVLDDVPGMTTGEIRSTVARRAPAEHDRVGRASDAFERVWYAREDAGPHHRVLRDATAGLAHGARRHAGSPA